MIIIEFEELIQFVEENKKEDFQNIVKMKKIENACLSPYETRLLNLLRLNLGVH